jgi:hypothetical protein
MSVQPFSQFVAISGRAAVWLAPLVALSALISFAAISRVPGRAEPTPAAIQALNAGAISPGQSPDGDVQGLVIALRPSGFSPSEIEIAEGRFLFIVQNRCGIRDLTFRLDREGGERLYEVHDRKLQWKKEFDLSPGTYVISVVDHPEWSCLIRVKAR